MRRLSVLLITLMLITLVAACESNTPDDPQTVATKYLQATQEGRFADGYRLLSADSQAQISSEEYTRRMERSRSDAKIQELANLNVQNANTANNIATVPYSVDVTLADGTTTSLFESLRLLRQGNNWLVIWPLSPRSDAGNRASGNWTPQRQSCLDHAVTANCYLDNFLKEGHADSSVPSFC